MYGFLLQLHSIVRWLVLFGIIIMLARAYVALLRPRPFSRIDHACVTAGSHTVQLQMLLGLALYFSSPFVSFFWSDLSAGFANRQVLFFSAIHIGGMITAVVLLTIGSARATRAEEDRPKFRTIAIYWTIALLLILALIPWPFSPFAQRPLLRFF